MSYYTWNVTKAKLSLCSKMQYPEMLDLTLHFECEKLFLISTMIFNFHFKAHYLVRLSNV